MVDVLYSLVDVDERFNQLILDHFYIRHLNMTIITIKSVFDRMFSIDNQVLDRIFEKILPRIHHQINQLTVEPHSMDHLLTINYPQLYSLSLVDFQEKILLQYLKSDSILCDLSKQITHLNIDIEMKTRRPPLSKTLPNIFVLILSLFQQLIYLNFCASCRYRQLPICFFKPPSKNCMSSTLTSLNINVETFADCLYFLDGRLNCLSTSIIHVVEISPILLQIRNTKKVRKLKSFSLFSNECTMGYDNLIIPLLHRMINLEELKFLLSIRRIGSTSIDGIQLHVHDEILIYMPRLNKFNFSINTTVLNKNIKIDLASNEIIQRSFIGRGYGQVGSYVQTIATENKGQSHVYSLPYQFEDLNYLNNSFQGGMFDKVRSLMMIDAINPFERNFFQMISQNFPSLKELYMWSPQPQKDEQHLSSLIIFPHLMLLSLDIAHVDYAEQFLFDKNTHLPRLLNLDIGYESLAIVTNNFTNDAACLTCSKLKYLQICEPFVRPQNFDQYFPLL